MNPLPYHRIIVIGTTGSGKSTLAEKLARQLGLDFIDLDALHWEPNWTDAPLDVFRQRVDVATRKEKWALAGNYSAVRDITWPRAEAIIWLDYPFWTSFWRLVRRTWRRCWTRELLWGTNRENLWQQLKIWSDDSLFHWFFKTYGRRKREIPTFLALPQHTHLHLIHFHNPQETKTWLSKITDHI